MRKNNLHVPIHIQMIIHNYSCLVKDTAPSSWRGAIRRPLWQDEETHLRALTVKPGLFASGSNDVQRRRCVLVARAMLPCRLKAPDRGETTERVHEWKRRNIVHISSLNVCKGKWTEPRTVGENISFSFFFFFSFLEVLQDNMITAQGLKEKKHGGIGTKWNPTDAIVLLLNQGSLQKAVLSSLLCSPFLRLFLSVCHFLFSSPPFPVVSMLSIPTYLTWLSLHFAARFSLLL